MAKTAKLRPWTEEDVRTLKTLAREKTKTIVIARKLKRTLAACRTDVCNLIGNDGFAGVNVHLTLDRVRSAL